MPTDRRKAIALVYIAVAVTVNLVYNLGLVLHWWAV